LRKEADLRKNFFNNGKGGRVEADATGGGRGKKGNRERFGLNAQSRGYRKNKGGGEKSTKSQD